MIRAEQKLLTSESNLNAVIENTDAFIYSLDREFRFITYNAKLEKTMQELYGITISPGYNVFDFIGEFNPTEFSEWQRIYVKALNGEIVQFEKRVPQRQFSQLYQFLYSSYLRKRYRYRPVLLRQ